MNGSKLRFCCDGSFVSVDEYQWTLTDTIVTMTAKYKTSDGNKSEAKHNQAEVQGKEEM